MTPAPKKYPHTDLSFAPISLSVEERGGGEMVLSNPTPIPSVPPQLGAILRTQAEANGDRTFLAERDADFKWRSITYGEMRDKADAVSQWLLDNGHGADNPIACLSDNSINFAILQLGAMQVGVPFMPVSPAYSLMSQDFAKIKYIFESFTPSLVFVEALAPFAKALQSVDLSDVPVVSAIPGTELDGVIPFSDLTGTTPGPAVEAAFAKVGGDTIAKVLLTSGSTGMPKGVINTQGMLCFSQEMMYSVWPFLGERPPVLCDWLPWNHTFGANFCFNTTMRHGGTLYIDGGKPAPGRFEATVKNMRDVKPTWMTNVARAYELVLPELEKDDAFAKHVFGDMDMIFYAGAGLPQTLWDRLEAVSVKVRGKRIPILTSLGSTETSPPALICYWGADVTGSVGLPMTGLDVKLVPSDGKIEARVRGPNITPGYYRSPEKTAEAFDEEGFYKLGDAVKWADPNDKERGLMFDGRVAENFKLLTGTWVAVGNLRLAVCAAGAPIISDAVITGENQEEVGLLVFPNFAGCKEVIGDAAKDMTPEDLVADARVHAALAEKLSVYNKANPGSSTRIERVLLMTEPPHIDSGEITDKGYLNQRAVRTRRAEMIDRMYAARGSGGDVVVVSGSN
jgi:feruloyl-CoA synthase